MLEGKPLLLCVTAAGLLIMIGISSYVVHATEPSTDAVPDPLPRHPPLPFPMDAYLESRCAPVQHTFRQLIDANLAWLRDFVPLNPTNASGEEGVPPHQQAFVVVSIVDGKMVVDRDHLARSSGAWGVVPSYINALAVVNSLVRLPNVYLAFNPRDEPQRGSTSGQLVMGYCTTRAHADVMIPYGMAGFDLFHHQDEYGAFVVNPRTMHDPHRLPVAYWRGMNSGNGGWPKGRGVMHAMHMQYPDRVNVGFADWDPPDGHRKPFLSLLDAARRYKYHLWIPGNCGSVRLPWQLLADVVVMKVESNEQEYFHSLLRPFEHFIPVTFDTDNGTNLIEMLDWAESHLEEVDRVRQQSTQFALDYLNPTAVECYWAMLVKELSGMVVQPVEHPANLLDVSSGLTV